MTNVDNISNWSEVKVNIFRIQIYISDILFCLQMYNDTEFLGFLGIIGFIYGRASKIHRVLLYRKLNFDYEQKFD